MLIVFQERQTSIVIKSFTEVDVIGRGKKICILMVGSGGNRAKPEAGADLYLDCWMVYELNTQT